MLDTIPDRILMTADTVGGVWNYAVDLARALQPSGVEVVLATMGGALSDAQREAAAALPNVELHESTFLLEWMDDPWDDVAAAGAWLLDLEARTRPDVIHLNSYAHAGLPWRAPVLVVGHSCVYSWFEGTRGTAPPATMARYHDAVRDGLRRADLVTAPTEAMLAALRRHYGTFRRAAAVYNGRRAADYVPAAKEPIVLTAGRLWDEAKNTSALQQVAPRITWPVYVAGEEQHPDNHGHVYLEGLQRLGRLAPAELAAWMGRAGIYALPARYEPFGLTALEAALAGCALVLGDIPTLREVWGDTASFVPPDDHDALAATLQAFIDDPERRARQARRVRARALTYTLERMAQGYLSLYETLLLARTPALSIAS